MASQKHLFNCYQFREITFAIELQKTLYNIKTSHEPNM